LQLVHLVLAIVLDTSNTRITIAAISIGIVATSIFGSLSHYDHFRSFRPSTILNVYLLGSVPMDAARARTLWRMPDNEPIAAVFTTIVCCKFILLLLEAKEKRVLLKTAYNDIPPEVTAGILNRSWFWWFNPLLLAGYKRSLDVEDLFVVDDDIGFRTKEDDMYYRWTNGMYQASIEKLIQ
jgi:ATP-binding cassette, subfamily C (CFTR/MRP), member 1